MTKKLFFLATIAVMFFSSCEKYDHAIADIEDTLEKIEYNAIATIDLQITAINGSIDDLMDVDSVLKVYIDSLQNTATDLQEQINETNIAIDSVKKEMGDEIDAVEQSLLDQLNDLKTSLESEIASVKEDIEELKAKDAELEDKIAALQTYVETQLKGTCDWVNATFATLAQYENVQTTIKGIENDIEEINTAMTNMEKRINEKITTDIQNAIDKLRSELGDGYAKGIETITNEITSAYESAIATTKNEIEKAYTQAIKDAISKSEEEMKKWVNAELQKVHEEIAEAQADLNALASSAATDDELAIAVAEQQKALEQAKQELTSVYEAAIKEAIEKNNGVIDEKISDAITTATKNLQSEIDSIKSEIASIKDRMKTLETNFANRIQSLIHIPIYSDGKIKMDEKSHSAQLYFRISPSHIATIIEKEHVKAFARYTENPSTRALNPEMQMNTDSIKGDSSGIIEVNISEKEGSGFDDSFWNGDKEAVVYICISDGNSDVVSEVIPLVGK